MSRILFILCFTLMCSNISSVLVIFEEEVGNPPATSVELFRDFPYIRTRNDNFLGIGVEQVGPHGTLYVAQREMAIIDSRSRLILRLGSDGASAFTIIAILKHTDSGAMGVVHIDGQNTWDCITNLAQEVQDLSDDYEGELELYLIGGIADPQGINEGYFVDILQAVVDHDLHISLELALVGRYNTLNGVPRRTGAVIDVNTRNVLPATFTDYGPDFLIRTARRMRNVPGVANVYDYNSQLFQILPFTYAPMPAAAWLLDQTDEYITEQLCASSVGRELFAAGIRPVFQFIRDNPNPLNTVFRNNRTIRYRKNDMGLWV